jgi:endonuclease VIII
VPEGDTIYRTAAALRAALIGRSLKAFETQRIVVGVRPKMGSVIERVESHGKHLEMGWDDGTVLHTHLRMSGSWHLYRVGERWRRPINQARVVVLTELYEAVCFNAPIIETYRAHDYLWHPGLGRLGPDLGDPDPDFDDAADRIDRFCERENTVAEILLDQRVAAGVGNVWKSETLWLCSLHPETPVGALDRSQRLYLLRSASDLLRANLDRVDRVTTVEIGGLAVYGRANRRCYRCNGQIEVARHNEQVRVTYWCGECQLYLPMPDAPMPESETVLSARWFGPRPTMAETYGDDESEIGAEIVISDAIEIPDDIDLYDEPVFAAALPTFEPAVVEEVERRQASRRHAVDPLIARAQAARDR